jgi:Neurotransmitter-gated ion-channel ligand binding domain
MKNRTLLFAFFLFIASLVHAQKDTCKIGLYLNSVYDFDLEHKSYMTDFWMWMNYKNDSLKLDDALEIPNSKTAEFSHFSIEKKGNLNWATQKCKAEIMYQWDVSKFPFDEQRLRIELEDAKYDTSQLIYIADTANSKVDCSFNSKEWRIESFKVVAGQRTYKTTYGNPELKGSSSYPRVVAELVIRRNNSWLMLAKMLTGAYVAFLIACLVFFVSSENQDSRFGLCVGGLFAAIGNKYIVESVVPTSTTNTLMDNVHNLTFTFILLIVGIIIISLYLFESGDEVKRKKSLKLDRWAFFSVITVYILINVFLVWRAIK